MYAYMSIMALMVFMLNSMPHISLSLFTMWFCLDNQSAMYKLGPGFYCTHTLYCCILIIMHYSLCDSVVISILNIVTRTLWYVISFLLWGSNNGGTSQGHLVFQLPSVLCCNIFIQHWTDFCL